MIGELLLFLVLLAQLSPSEMEARRIWFKATIARTALAPCMAALPEHATGFRSATAEWLQANAHLVDEGEASFRREAGDAFRPDEFDQDGASRQFADLLASFPREQKLQWCREQLQIMQPNPPGAHG